MTSVIIYHEGEKLTGRLNVSYFPSIKSKVIIKDQAYIVDDATFDYDTDEYIIHVRPYVVINQS